MPFAIRDDQGRVVALSDRAGEGSEALPANHPDVLDFLFRDAAPGERERQLLASDLGFIRVVEDLIEVLVRKHVISLSDLPAAAQEKMLGRAGLRSYVQDVFAEIVADDGAVI